MGFVYRKQIPGKADINDTFSKMNIARTRKIYEGLVKSGKYRFGDLTAHACGLDADQKLVWEKEVDEFYSADIQSEVIRVIEAAFSHKDSKGADDPIAVSFKWSDKLAEEPSNVVRTTYYPSSPSYQIEFCGYPPPLGSLLSARRDGSAGEE